MDSDTHQRQAQKHKEVFEKKKSAATLEKGLLIVNTGTGKGKTTAAMGMGVRVLGHGMKLAVVQFIKGALLTGEREFFTKQDNCDFYTIGDGYTWDTQNREQDVATARKAWAQAVEVINKPEYAMVILDELNIVLKHSYLPIDEVLDVLKKRRPDLHIVITGRHAPEALVEAADLVSEIKVVKHPYQEQGVKAQRGVEF